MSFPLKLMKWAKIGKNRRRKPALRRSASYNNTWAREGKRETNTSCHLDEFRALQTVGKRKRRADGILNILVNPIQFGERLIWDRGEAVWTRKAANSCRSKSLWSASRHWQGKVFGSLFLIFLTRRRHGSHCKQSAWGAESRKRRFTRTERKGEWRTRQVHLQE